MNQFLHESLLRGKDTLKKLAETRLTICGLGAIGSNLSENLTRQGFRHFTIIDFDRIEEHNIGTQSYHEDEIGMLKVTALSNHLYRISKASVEYTTARLNESNVKKLLAKSEIVIDSFDNRESRKVVTEFCLKNSLPCLHTGLAEGYGEVVWNEIYRIPQDRGVDACLPGSTKILTKRGVKELKNIKAGEVVLSCTSQGKMVWRNILSIWESNPQKWLLKFTIGPQIIFECTPEHHMVRATFTKRHRMYKNKGLEVVSAKDLRPGNFVLLPRQEIDTDSVFHETIDLIQALNKKDFKYDGKHVWYVKSNKQKRFVNTTDLAKLLAWYVAEGSASGKKPSAHTVYIWQENKENKEEIYKLATRVVNPFIGKAYIGFSGPISELFLTCGKKAKEKHLPNWILNLPNSHLEDVFEALVKGDGRVTDKWGRKGYYTISQTLAAQVQYIGIRLGYRTAVQRIKRYPKTFHLDFSKSTKKPKGVFNGTSFAKIKSIEKVRNTEKLFDLTVENTHTLVAGKQGFIICSQCNYALSRNTVLLTVVVASETIIDFIVTGKKMSRAMTSKDFAIHELGSS